MSAPKVSPTAEEHDTTDSPPAAVEAATPVKDFMTPEEAAADIGCGERWLRDGANKRGFPHHRFGKALWFSTQDRDEIRSMNRQPARFRSKPRKTKNVAA